MKEKTKVGEYTLHLQNKGYDEACIEGIKNGEAFYTIQLDKFGQFDTKSQAEAEIISRLVRIENMLKRVEKK